MGGISRASDRKSLKLYARWEYGINKFFYEFFPDSRTKADDKKTEEYKRLVLRNNYSIPNTVMMELLKNVPALDVQEYRPVVGYLNGDYYQTGWMMEDYDKTYFHTNYGTTEEAGAWETVADYNESVLDGLEEADTPPQVSGLQTEKLAAESKEFYDKFMNKDFLDEAVFQLFCQQVDVEQMLWYFAAEIYMCNLDWPYNNIKMYRWYSYDDTYEEEGAMTDGKWRYLLYDLDGGFNTDPETNLLAHVLNTTNEEYRHHRIFYNLMQREDMRIRFKEIMELLIADAFEAENACTVIEDTYAMAEAQLVTAIEEVAYDSDYDTDYAAQLEENLTSLKECKEIMLDFARRRPEIIRQQMENLLPTP